ncbi:MAG: hypothetical protein HP490_06915 [Nitrospira sp.]|nr:hypothetical protein [Nitrospira sp.]
MRKALLALADGACFEGRALGHEGETVGEVVFNTAMTGYQEVLTDPSYKGQIITMTCSHIGNYGTTPEDSESRRLWAEGFVVMEASRLASNWRGTHTIHEYLTQAKVVAIEGLDTRALTRHLREHGSQQGVITHGGLDTRSNRSHVRSPQGHGVAVSRDGAGGAGDFSRSDRFVLSAVFDHRAGGPSASADGADQKAGRWANLYGRSSEGGGPCG